MKISFVVAVAKNGVIGKRNDLPFYIPEDLKHFRRITQGHTVLMGRNTFDAIIKRLGKPLPNRRSAVITHRTDLKFPEGVLVFHDINSAVAKFMSEGVKELMVIGGAQIYRQFADLERVDRIYMTHVHREVDGDVMFPQLNLTKRWRKSQVEEHKEFTWVTYDRI